jgi:hypothetical protein
LGEGPPEPGGKVRGSRREQNCQKQTKLAKKRRKTPVRVADHWVLPRVEEGRTAKRRRKPTPAERTKPARRARRVLRALP